MPTVAIESQVVAYPLVGVISPWNAPLMLALLDAVPALFAGSAVLLKPSEVTPRVIETLFETVREVPELAAVFDYVTGPGEVGQAVIAEADTICFTGSVPTGPQGRGRLRRAADPVQSRTGRQGSVHRHRNRRSRTRGDGGAARRGLCHRAGVLLGRAGLCARERA